MSWQALQWVLHNSDVNDYVEFRVLALLADRANPDGTASWWKQDDLAQAVRRSDRTVRRALKSLREAGHIRFGDHGRVTGQANYRPRAYDIVMSEGAASEPPADESGWTHDDQPGWTSGDQIGRTSGVHPSDSGWTSDGQTGRTSDVHKTTHITTPSISTQPHTEPNTIADPIPIDRARKPGKGKATRIPDDWQPDQSHFELGAELGMNQGDVRKQAARFHDHYRSNGYVLCDWGAKFNNWLRTAADGTRLGKVSGDGYRTPPAAPTPDPRTGNVMDRGRW